MIDFSTPRTVSAAALYAAAILSAAPLLSLRGTVLTGVFALLIDWMMFRYSGYRRSAIAVSELIMVATVTVIAGFLNRVLKAAPTEPGHEGRPARRGRAMTPGGPSHVCARAPAARRGRPCCAVKGGPGLLT
ncbi:hypothetical protein ACFVXE_04215 [Streptomyces sp. NPDC058231]|uniref:hypothetical protein n=1 Tax=Streptomyces sp. NPDC058231 TaxID=3346392 RepID=UPI0036E01C46